MIVLDPLDELEGARAGAGRVSLQVRAELLDYLQSEIIMPARSVRLANSDESGFFKLSLSV